jgi:hypothetical protein
MPPVLAFCRGEHCSRRIGKVTHSDVGTVEVVEDVLCRARGSAFVSGT